MLGRWRRRLRTVLKTSTTPSVLSRSSRMLTAINVPVLPQPPLCVQICTVELPGHPTNIYQPPRHPTNIYEPPWIPYKHFKPPRHPTNIYEPPWMPYKNFEPPRHPTNIYEPLEALWTFINSLDSLLTFIIPLLTFINPLDIAR